MNNPCVFVSALLVCVVIALVVIGFVYRRMERRQIHQALMASATTLATQIRDGELPESMMRISNWSEEYQARWVLAFLLNLPGEKERIGFWLVEFQTYLDAAFMMGLSRPPGGKATGT